MLEAKTSEVSALRKERLQLGISHVIGWSLAEFIPDVGRGAGGQENADDLRCLFILSSGARRTGLNNRTMQRCGTGFATGKVHIGAMFDERLNGDRAAETNRVMESGDTIFIGRMNIRALL